MCRSGSASFLDNIFFIDLINLGAAELIAKLFTLEENSRSPSLYFPLLKSNCHKSMSAFKETQRESSGAW